MGFEQEEGLFPQGSTPVTTSSMEQIKLSGKGIILIPQPTEDEQDPLNWSFRRKATIVATLSLAMFAGYSAPFCGQININQQAELYQKSTVQITYFNSAASAGLVTGGCWPLFLQKRLGDFWWPLARKFGGSSVILWSLLGVLAAQIWAPLMTGANQYGPYLASRYLAAFCAVVINMTAPRYLVDMFFLHQRGRAFAVFHLAHNAGSSVGSTIGGFVASSSYWPTEYWWSVGLVALTIITVFLFLEETRFDRSGEVANRIKPESWIRDRVETFMPGTKVVPRVTWGQMAKSLITPFKIGIAPVLLIIAAFDTISFGFYVALNALTPVWLQTPKAHGGLYGFTVAQNAAFSFNHWAGFIVAVIYGQLFSDRIPLWLVERNKGVWKPEFRLYILWPTSFVLMPLGLGLVGICLQYKLHWAAMAVGSFFVTLASQMLLPVTVNYICECFRGHTVEAALVLNSVHSTFGLSINFYIQPWVAAVGIGWVYGSMAFFAVFAFCFLIVLMLWGDKIRAMSPFQTSESEDGALVLKTEDRRF